MAVVNTINPMTLNPNAKDSRWLTLEVCREYQRNKCTRTENECKFAHPPAHVEVQNGRVVACFDSIKGKCQRKDPPCKYLHPPQHLREQLLQNGRNNLILKSLQLQAALHHPQVVPGLIPVGAPVKSVQPAGGKPVAYQTAVLPGQIPYVGLADSMEPYQDHYRQAAATSQSRPAHVSHPASFGPHYLTSVPTSAVHQFSPYGIPTVAVPGGADGTMVTQQIPGVISTPISKAPARPDRLERVSESGETAGDPLLSDPLFLGSHQVCREFQRGTCSRQPSDCRYAHPTENVTVDCGENQVTVCMDYVKNKCTRDSCRYFHPPTHLQSQIKAAQQRANVAAPPSGGSGGPAHGAPQVVEVLTASKKRHRDPAEELVMPHPIVVPPPYKRMAMDSGSLGKGGIPMYQPLQSPYQQAATLMHLPQQPYIPVTYSGEVMSPAYTNYLPQDQLMVAGPAPAPPPPVQPPGVGAAAAVVGTLTSPAAAASAATAIPGVSARKIPSNAYNVEYFDRNKQLLDTLPLCRDFRVGLCDRPSCRKVHVLEEVETTEDGRVVVCRDSVRNACKRTLCKYYHIPVPLPPST